MQAGQSHLRPLPPPGQGHPSIATMARTHRLPDGDTLENEEKRQVITYLDSSPTVQNGSVPGYRDWAQAEKHV